ncbi:SH3 domain-containing protein [bacterium]|nr:SH3 domain-containing protein [bacterium]
MTSHRQPIAAIVLFLLLGAVGIWISTVPAVAAPAAQATPCATPSTRSGRGRAVGSASACESTAALPGKASFAERGGATDAVLPCEGFLSSQGNKFFSVFPSSTIVEVGKPYVNFDMAVQWCDWPTEDEFTFILTDPAGRTVTRTQGTYFTYRFADTPTPGEYGLTITGEAGTLRETFLVDLYRRPTLKLFDAVTGEEVAPWLVNSAPTNRQRGLQVHYAGFSPDETIEVGLYLPSAPGATLLETWQVISDEQGKFEEVLTFPDSLPQGYYLLMACSINWCSLIFDPVGEPWGSPNGVEPPPLAWQQFSLSAPTRPARVDPVGAWDGLRLREGPGTSFARIGSLPPNTLVTVLQGPDRANGIDWYEVRAESDGRQGWVSGEYLLFGVDSAISIPTERTRVSFSPGTTGASFSAPLSAGQPLAYGIRALRGQALIIETDRTDVVVNVVDSAQTPLTASDVGAGYWRFELPQNDDYTVILNGSQRTRVRIEIP